MLKSDIASSVGRWLVFGSMAVMGGVLALAPVTAPPAAPRAKAQDRTAPPAAAVREGQPQPARPADPQDRTAGADARRAAPQDRVAGAEAQPVRRAGLGIEFDAQAREGLSITNIQADSLAA